MITTRHKEKSLSALENDLDDVFREFIVLRDFFPGCKCFVCEAQMKRRSEGEVGHFIPRGNMATRTDEDNCHFICFTCNRDDPDHYKKYKAAIQNKLGKHVAAELEQKGHSIMKRMRFEVQELILDYHDKVAKLRKEKNL